jgi:hypothetical protein
MVTRAQHQQALDQQKADREANKQQKAYHQKYTSMTQREVVEHLQKTEPERIAKTGHSLNIGKFLENKGASSDPNVPILKFGAQSVRDVAIQKPIDVSKITDSSWMRGSTYKQHEARKTLADYETIPSNIPTVQQDEPTSRRMGFGQGGGAAQVSGYQTITEPTSFTDFAFGRINTPIQETIVEEPEVIEETKTIQPDYTKIALIGVGVFAVLALIIVRIKK